MLLSESAVAERSRATSENVELAMALAPLRVGEAAAALLPAAGKLGQTVMFGDVPLKRFLLRAPSIPAAKCDGGHVGARVTPGRWGAQPAPTRRMLQGNTAVRGGFNGAKLC